MPCVSIVRSKDHRLRCKALRLYKRFLIYCYFYCYLQIIISCAFIIITKQIFRLYYSKLNSELKNRERLPKF
ncbi:MAG: hypothetical protein LBB88_05035 [Planctomycetaceae bacterium]|nr:hypothetical protein [Planctomycetaceae bacterium]